MLSIPRWILICWFLLSVSALAQTEATLQTAETQLQLQGGLSAPRLLTLKNSQTEWRNYADETPIPNVEIAGQMVNLKWTLNTAASRADTRWVSFVYDAAYPNLRLVWIWECRSEHGPIEHHIRIENHDTKEMWLPLQPSFLFKWKAPSHERFAQLYVEKGADTPSATGTHLAAVPEGYRWEGTSSTYAQPRPGESREIIPYVLVERVQNERSGWYVGIEFSGRTHLTLNRTGEFLSGEAGLNPYPGPFLTRL